MSRCFLYSRSFALSRCFERQATFRPKKANLTKSVVVCGPRKEIKDSVEEDAAAGQSIPVITVGDLGEPTVHQGDDDYFERERVDFRGSQGLGVSIVPFSDSMVDGDANDTDKNEL